MYADSIMLSVVKNIPHLAKAMGSDNTAPPTIVAIKLKEATKRLDRRSGEAYGGAK